MLQKQALGELKVLGFVTAAAGPMLLRRLAMHGATVVRVESSKRPDITRTMTPFKDDKPGLNRSYRFAVNNPDQYDLCMDLKHPQAKEVTRRLIGWADVLVDNYRPGVMERLGLGYEEVRAIKPEVIMISMSQQGQTGPYRTTAGYGPDLAGNAGFVALTGWPDRAPVSVGAYPDYVSPRFGTVAVLAALDYRRRTGMGQYIDLSQYETSIHFLTPAILDCTVNNRIENRNGNKCDYAAPHGVYRCKGDDRWCAMAVFTDSEWKAFCEVIDAPEWTLDTKFSTLAGRKENEDELNRLVEEWTAEHVADEVMINLQKAGVEAGAVRTVGEVIESCPQTAYRNYWRTTVHPEVGATTVDGCTYILSKTPYQVLRPAPCLGEHTEYVCTQLLGIPDEEFVELERDGVFR
ncbi:MAG: CoA transferase [Chloroflexi bacterium]|nr:CoA transferase [Chloroflexota bacterium]